MSELGPIAYGDNQDHVFLGREISRDQNYSEDTAQAIDRSIRLIVETQYKRCREIIVEHMENLHTLAAALLEYETVEGKHVDEIIETGSLQTSVLRPEPTLVEDEKDEKEEKKKETEDEKEMGGGPEPAGAPA